VDTVAVLHYINTIARSLLCYRYLLISFTECVSEQGKGKGKSVSVLN
jgi:hypothetical protein